MVMLILKRQGSIWSSVSFDQFLNPFCTLLLTISTAHCARFLIPVIGWCLRAWYGVKLFHAARGNSRPISSLMLNTLTDRGMWLLFQSYNVVKLQCLWHVRINKICKTFSNGSAVNYVDFDSPRNGMCFENIGCLISMPSIISDFMITWLLCLNWFSAYRTNKMDHFQRDKTKSCFRAAGLHICVAAHTGVLHYHHR